MKRLSILSLMFFFYGCGESPLFNHKLEKALSVSDSLFSESNVLKFSKTDYSFTIIWQEGPQLGESKFIMRTWKKDLGTLNGPYQDLNQNLHVFLWMPTMGHGSVPVKIKRIANGEYEVSNVQFIMGGKWEVKFQLKQGGRVSDEAVVSLTL